VSDLEERLGAVARKHLGVPGISALKRLSAGATQEIFRIELADEKKTPIILRRSPGERIASGMGMEVEARLLQLTEAAGAPVPHVLHILEPEDGLGRGFLMTFVEGETLGHKIVRDDAFAAVRPKLARQCGEILAKVHAVDPSGFDELETFTPHQLIDQWRGRYLATDWPRPVMELAFRWLYDHCPPAPKTKRLVHGDFRNGNLIFGPDDGVRAVIDWELAHIGDPMEDLGWICVNSWRFGAVDKPVGGFGTREDLFAGYAAAGGDPVDPSLAKYWEVYGSMRWGVMCAGLTQVFRVSDRSPDRAAIARRASENEVDLMRLLAGEG